MPEWLQILVSRMGLELPPATWEDVFRGFARVEEKLQDAYQRLVRINAVSPVPAHLVEGYRVWARNVYDTQIKLRGAAIRAGIPAASVPVPRLVAPPPVRTVQAGQSALGAVAIPMHRIGQLTRPVPGTVGALGAAPIVYVGVAAAVIAVVVTGIAVVWWSGAAAVEAVARWKLTEAQGRNLITAIDAQAQCIQAAGTNAQAIAACAAVVPVSGANPATDIPALGDRDPLAGVVDTVKALLTLGAIGGVIYGAVVIVKKLRE
jgi:hypothetical protein